MRDFCISLTVVAMCLSPCTCPLPPLRVVAPAAPWLGLDLIVTQGPDTRAPPLSRILRDTLRDTLES